MTQCLHVHLLGALLTMFVLAAPRAGAQDLDPERLAAVRAGILVNFVRYTTWPEGAFEEDKSPIVVTIVGETDVDEALSQAAAGVVINGRSIQIEHARYPDPPEGQSAPTAEDLEAFYRKLRESHAIYVGDSEKTRVDELLKQVDGRDVLTISAIDGFAEKGGMLGLTIRGRRVAFDANDEAIKETRLQVSSQVLKLARIVRTAEEEDPEASP